MPTLFFFPWISVSASVALGEIELVPYVRGAQPSAMDGMSLADIDAVLANYGVPAFRPETVPAVPVPTATLARFPGDDPAVPLTDDMLHDRLRIARQVAFCCVSTRPIGARIGYCNADTFTVIAQRFIAGNPSGMAITTRRRDGSAQMGLSGSLPGPRFVRPLHVDHRATVKLDYALFSALALVTDPELKARLEDATELYLLANTDSSQVPERAELVMLRAAFETLLQSGHTTDKLVGGFRDHFAGELPEPPIWHAGVFDETAWRGRWPRKVTRPFDAWVRDFCDARNRAAHGLFGHRDSLWSRENHLLFASWLLPLVMKGLLATSGTYIFSEDDKLLRAGLEAFLSRNLLAFDEEDSELEWNKVMRDLLFDRWMSRLR